MSKIFLVLSFCLASCFLTTPPVRAFEEKAPTSETLKKKLSAAIEQFDQQSSYRWTTEDETTEEMRFRPGPVTGVTVRGGETHVTLSFGPRSTQVVIKGEKAAVTNREGRWEAIWLSDQGYSSEGIAASIARGVRLPIEEAKALFSSVKLFYEEGDMLVGALPSNVAKEHLSHRRGTEAVRDAKGTVRFSVIDGLLTKYVICVEGKLVNDDQTREVWQQTTIELFEIGTAKIDLPGGATEVLKRPIPKPEPRLSDAEAAKLLSLRGKRDVGVHDPSSFVKCGSEYWFFSTGTGVSSWRSNDLQSWQRGPQVFPNIQDWVTDVVPGQRGHLWAPDVLQFGDRYLLYYSVSSFGRNTSAIALASTPTLNPDDPAFGWTDHGIVIQSSGNDDFNAIDPAVVRTESGELWMSFGSFWSGLKLIKLDPQSGKRSADDATLYSIASYRQIEAPHIYEHDGWFYLFVNWGKCCSGVDSTYNIRVGRSRAITGPYLDKDGVDLASGGGTLLLGSEGPFIGPGHANVAREGNRFLFSCHYYDGTERGRSMLSIQELSWSKDGWPLLAGNARQ